MARDSGRWVQRAGATGGGRTYRGQVPTNWYVGLVVIVILGLVSIGFARYEYRNPANPATATAYAGVSFEICGTSQPALAANSSSTGVSTTGNGVLLSRTSSNATLGQFVAGYRGLRLTATSVQLPGSKSLVNGEPCGSSTPAAGKKGTVRVYSFKNVEAKNPHLVAGNPLDLVITPGELISVVFGPKGAKVQKSPSVEAALLQAQSAASSTPATTTPGSTSSVPNGTTSSVPNGTTPSVPNGTTPIPAGSTNVTPTTATRK